MTALILHVCCTHYTYFILRNVVFFGYSCCCPSVRICLMISNELYCLLESKSALRNHYWLWIPKFGLFKWFTILWKRVRTTTCWLFNLLGINENVHCTVMSAYAIASHSCLALGIYVHEKKGLPPSHIDKYYTKWSVIFISWHYGERDWQHHRIHCGHIWWIHI